MPVESSSTSYQHEVDVLGLASPSLPSLIHGAHMTHHSFIPQFPQTSEHDGTQLLPVYLSEDAGTRTYSIQKVNPSMSAQMSPVKRLNF